MAGDDADIFIFISISRVLGGCDTRMLTNTENENPIFVAFGVEDASRMGRSDFAGLIAFVCRQFQFRALSARRHASVHGRSLKIVEANNSTGSPNPLSSYRPIDTG